MTNAWGRATKKKEEDVCLEEGEPKQRKTNRRWLMWCISPSLPRCSHITWLALPATLRPMSASVRLAQRPNGAHVTGCRGGQQEKDIKWRRWQQQSQTCTLSITRRCTVQNTFFRTDLIESSDFSSVLNLVRSVFLSFPVLASAIYGQSLTLLLGTVPLSSLPSSPCLPVFFLHLIAAFGISWPPIKPQTWCHGNEGIHIVARFCHFRWVFTEMATAV